MSDLTSDCATASSAKPARSLLVVPACRPELFAKAALSAADAILIDLEDSVAPADKAAARNHALDAIADVDWGAKTLSLRINGLDTPYMYRDLVDILEKPVDRLDLVMIPKAGRSADICVVDTIVGQIELATGRKTRIGLEAQIETAGGLAAVDSIAAASPRLRSLHFGSGDFAASMHIRTPTIGAPVPAYGVLADPVAEGARPFHAGDVWHYATSRIVVAARSHNLLALDGPFADFGDQDGFMAQARRGVAQGFDGKWAIHPSQIEPANRAFSPSGPEIAQARRIVDAMRAAGDDNRGAVTLDGRMVDMASVRQAETLLAIAEQIAAPDRAG